MAENSALKLLLEKQITTEQYKIIDDYKKMAENLEREQERTRNNEAKLQELQKKISCLEFMNSTSIRESTRYQRKLEKLENTQNYATQLLKLKYQSFVKMEKDQHARREECMTKRELMEHNRKLSLSVFDHRKSERIKKIKEEEQRISFDLKRKSSQLEATVREKREEAKEQELRMKERRKRYQMFKLQRAALNYHEKLEHEFSVFREQNQYLNQLKQRARKEEEMFRKTQILNKETLKIESIYLTGADI